MDKSFKEILTMVDNACINTFYTGDKNMKDTILQCATQIYIDQMRGANILESEESEVTEPGCVKRKTWNGIETGLKLCRDCGATYDSKCVCNATVQVRVPTSKSKDISVRKEK